VLFEEAFGPHHYVFVASTIAFSIASRQQYHQQDIVSRYEYAVKNGATQSLELLVCPGGWLKSRWFDNQEV